MVVIFVKYFVDIRIVGIGMVIYRGFGDGDGMVFLVGYFLYSMLVSWVGGMGVRVYVRYLLSYGLF